MTPLRRTLSALAVAVSATLSALAQLSYSGGTYTENFDSLPVSAAATLTLAGPGPHLVSDAPINGGAPGWSIGKISGSGANALFAVGTGSGNQGAAYSFGAASSSDRALGSLYSGTTGSALGVVLRNTTGTTITEFTVSYTGEQWRYGGSPGTDKLIFEYQLGGSSILGGGTFVAVPALDFVSPIHGDGVNNGTATALVGNNAPNKTDLTAKVSNISWTANQTLVLRWREFDVAPGADDGLALDNFSFTTATASVPVPPTVASSLPASGATDVSLRAAVAVKFNAAVNATGTWFSVTGSSSGTIAATGAVEGDTLTITPSALYAEGEVVMVTLYGEQITDAATGTETMAGDYSFTFTTEIFNASTIHAVQGNSTASPLVGQKVKVEGVVTGFYASTNASFGGFYIQSANGSDDGDNATSEGVFVNAIDFPVTIGQLVKVAGTVEERSSSGVTSTRLTSVPYVNLLSSGNPLPAPVAITLPFASPTAVERYEGMLVILPQALTVTENYQLGQYGELLLSNGRLNTPTNVVAPGAPAIALAAQNALNQILLDDSLDTANPDPTPFLADSASRGITRRSGSTVANVTGVLDHKFGNYTIEPTAVPTFVDANPRANPPAVTGSLKVAIGNVLNFFNGNGGGGGFPTSRGASTYEEYVRQRAKIIAGISAIAPDIMGLTEVENDGYGPTSAIADIVNGLNAAAPAGTTYAYIDAAAVNIVTDVIQCAFIYRTETVAPVGSPAMLNHSSFNGYARNPLAQTFKQLANGEKFTVTVNHFKSKSSASSGAGATNGITPNPNNDQGDGQGQSNYIRVLQANALAAWLATDPTGSGDPDFLIIGDLNAYAKEDPIVALEGHGYINLTEAAEGPGGYSYAFDGGFGHLDHALANSSLAAQVVDAVTWHVNADEPIFYDYNLENKSAAQQAINTAGPYRYSDHDPVVVGLNLGPPPAADITASLQITRGGFALNRRTGRIVQSVTIKNTSAQTFAAPMSLVFGGLSANATLVGATGTTAAIAPVGSPYLNVNVGADNALTPGETATVTLEFTNASTQGITYTPKVLAGPGAR